MLQLDFGRHDELLAIGQYVDDGRALMRKGCWRLPTQLARAFHAYAVNTHRSPAMLAKSGLSSRVPIGRKPPAFYLDVDEAQESVIEDDDLDR